MMASGVLQLEGDEPLRLGRQEAAHGNLIHVFPGPVLSQTIDLDEEAQDLLWVLEGEGHGVVLGQFVGLQQGLLLLRGRIGGHGVCGCLLGRIGGRRLVGAGGQRQEKGQGSRNQRGVSVSWGSPFCGGIEGPVRRFRRRSPSLPGPGPAR